MKLKMHHQSTGEKLAVKKLAKLPGDREFIRAGVATENASENTKVHLAA